MFVPLSKLDGAPSPHASLAVLDPRITYHGCLNAVGDDLDLRHDILDSKVAFESRFRSQYATLPTSAVSTSSPLSSPAPARGAGAAFSHFSKARHAVSAFDQELQVFFLLPPEDYDTCPDPVQWWASRRSQFPRLARMARNIFSIAGMYMFDLFLHAIWVC